MAWYQSRYLADYVQAIKTLHQNATFVWFLATLAGCHKREPVHCKTPHGALPARSFKPQSAKNKDGRKSVQHSPEHAGGALAFYHVLDGPYHEQDCRIAL